MRRIPTFSKNRHGRLRGWPVRFYTLILESMLSG
jgi:hypothetical protein